MLSSTELFSKALMLEPGGRIVMPCNSFSEMERVRIALYRQLNKLRKVNSQEAAKLAISRSSVKDEGKYIISIWYAADIKDAFIEHADGTVEELTTASADSELEYICTLMRKDGLSEDEIEQYREEYTATMDDSA